MLGRLVVQARRYGRCLDAAAAFSFHWKPYILICIRTGPVCCLLAGEFLPLAPRAVASASCNLGRAICVGPAALKMQDRKMKVFFICYSPIT